MARPVRRHAGLSRCRSTLRSTALGATRPRQRRVPHGDGALTGRTIRIDQSTECVPRHSRLLSCRLMITRESPGLPADHPPRAAYGQGRLCGPASTGTPCCGPSCARPDPILAPGFSADGDAPPSSRDLADGMLQAMAPTSDSFLGKALRSRGSSIGTAPWIHGLLSADNAHSQGEGGVAVGRRKPDPRRSSGHRNRAVSVHRGEEGIRRGAG